MDCRTRRGSDTPVIHLLGAAQCDFAGRIATKFVDIDPNLQCNPGNRSRRDYTAHPIGISGAYSGFPVDVKSVRELTKEKLNSRTGPHHTIHIIQDACEALGAESQGSKVGGFGDAGLFAFYPNKQITTGEGGVLVTSSAQIASRSAGNCAIRAAIRNRIGCSIRSLDSAIGSRISTAHWEFPS